MTAQEPTTAEKIRQLPWGIRANAANTVFVQFTFFGSVFVLFLNALGLEKAQIGFLLSFFPYTGLIALFIAPLVARFGYKRIFITFFGARKFAAALLLLTPWVLTSLGANTMLTFVSVVVLVFALCRAVAETANFPWIQEYVPSAVRGKYSANNNVFAALTGFLAVLVAGFVMERSTGLSGFMVLLGVGVIFGLLSVWAFSHLPGGAPVRSSDTMGATYRALLTPARDRNFLRFIFGAGLITLAMTPISSFLPLFMQEQVGLQTGNIILLQIGTLAGSLLSTYLWGWAADRYGSKPVMLTGGALRMLLPLCWFLMPRNSSASLYTALAIALLQGVVDMGWGIGSTRLLFVNVVPPQQKTEYMALYYAAVGVIGGSSQLLGGQLLARTQSVSGQFLSFSIDQYTILFGLGFVLMAASMYLLRRVRDDNIVSVGEFVGLFLKGNPFLAMSSLIGYHLAQDEQDVVSMTQRLGQTRSLLTVDELLASLTDPRFNVRYEAVIAISRTRPDPRLTEALIGVLHGSELALSVNAAWALGRLGDLQAIDSLREGLESRYASIQVQSARALGTLGDAEVIPLLLDRLENETDKGLQMAYASALGRLQAQEATPLLLQTLEATENEGARLELALALARIVGNEGHFIRLMRHLHLDTGTAASQALTAFKRKLGRNQRDNDDFITLLDQSTDALARQNLAQGIELLAGLIPQIAVEQSEGVIQTILQRCAASLGTYKTERLEYLLLVLHTLPNVAHSDHWLNNHDR